MEMSCQVGGHTLQKAKVDRDVDSYADMNTELFRRRMSIQERTRQLDEGSEASPPRSHARLRRELDDVTSEIVRFNNGLVRSYCRRFTSHANRDDSADFQAAGMLGLMRAIDSFDPRQGRFGHWAYKPIQREVLRAVHDADHANITLCDFERRPEILRAQRLLQDEDPSHVPTDKEVAALIGVPVDQARRVMSPPTIESMQQHAGDEEFSVEDTIESTTPGPEAVVVSTMTLSALKTYGLAALDPRELYVVVRRFGLDGQQEDKLSDIGETLGLSREAVRQIEVKAIAKIQHPLVLRKIQCSAAD
jgi:RNA polymerase sigma factor (sigma-70 family)